MFHWAAVIAFSQILSLYERCFCIHVTDSHDGDVPVISTINTYSNRLYNVAVISYIEAVSHHLKELRATISERETNQV